MRRSQLQDPVDRPEGAERRRDEGEHQPGPAERPVQAGGEHLADSAAALLGVDPIGVLGHVFVGVLDLDPVAVKGAPDELAVDDDRLALLEDPARLALVLDRQRRAGERDRERRDPVRRGHRALVDGALAREPATRLAARPRADLIDVAVVVDRRPEDWVTMTPPATSTSPTTTSGIHRRPSGSRAAACPHAGSDQRNLGPGLCLVGEPGGDPSGPAQHSPCVHGDRART